MIPNDHHESKTSEVGAAAVEYIGFGNNDSQHKSDSPIVVAGNVDACKLIPPISGAPTDTRECPTGSGNCCAVSEEDGKGYIATKEESSPVACESTCSLTVYKTDLSNCGTSREGDSCSLGNDGSAEEKNVRDDVGIVCALSSAMNDKNVYESHLSKSPQSTEGEVAVENNDRSTEHNAEKNSKLRARRKSKYLSFPFVEPIKGEPSKGEPSKESESPGDKSIQDCGNPSPLKPGRKRRQSSKSIAGSANLAATTISSAELLMKLHMVARDHLIPYYNKAFDPSELFFDSFRESVYSGLATSEVISTGKKARTDEKDVQKRNKTPVKKTKKEKNMTGSDDKAEVILNFSSSSSLTVDPQMGCSPLSCDSKLQKKRKRQEKNMAGSDNKAPSGPCDVIMNFASSSPLPVCPQMGPVKVEPLTNPGANEMARIPNLNSNNVVPSPTLDPLQASGHGEPKSEPGKKKNRVRKKGVTPMFSLTGFPYANGNGVYPCLQGSGSYSFAASTGLTANVASSPGFCAQGSMPRSPTPPPELSGFYANGSTPRPLAPTPKVPVFCAKPVPTPEHQGICAKGSTPRPLAPQPGLPGFFAKGSMPGPLSPPQKLPCFRAAEGSKPRQPAPPPGLSGFFAKGPTPGPPTPPPGLPGFFAKGPVPIMPKPPAPPPGLLANGSIPKPAAPPPGLPGFFAKSSTPRQTAPPPGLPGLFAKGSLPRPPAPPPGLLGCGAKGSMPRQPAPPPGLQSMNRANSAVGFDTNKKSSSEMTLDQMKQNLEFMTSMLEKSGNMISPVMRANLEKEIKNLLKKVDPMISSSSS